MKYRFDSCRRDQQVVDFKRLLALSGRPRDIALALDAYHLALPRVSGANHQNAPDPDQSVCLSAWELHASQGKCSEHVLDRIAHARPDWIPAAVLLRELRERGYRTAAIGRSTAAQLAASGLTDLSPEQLVQFDQPPLDTPTREPFDVPLECHY